MFTIMHSILTRSGRGRDRLVVCCQFDLQLPIQSVPITTKVVSLNPLMSRCIRYNIM